MNRLLLFIVGALLFGAVSLGAGYLAWEDDALVQGGTAFGLAFLPAAGTLAWVMHSYRTAPETRLLANLGGSGLRMMIALGGGYLLTNLYPKTFNFAFFCWLALFYLVLLFFEMAFLIPQENNVNGPSHTNLPGQSGGNG
jgi:hypothetical protein